MLFSQLVEVLGDCTRNLRNISKFSIFRTDKGVSVLSSINIIAIVFINFLCDTCHVSIKLSCNEIFEMCSKFVLEVVSNQHIMATISSECETTIYRKGVRK